jgi:hypothetical protein
MLSTFLLLLREKMFAPGPESALGRLACKRGVLFFTAVGLRFSSDKETAECKKMRIPSVLECQALQISPQNPCDVHDNDQTV